jgi:PAS domain S-box-containing protein
MGIVNYNKNSTTGLDLAPQSLLRRQAQKKIQLLEEMKSELLDPKTVRRLIHELQLHQVELEIQNKELEESQQELEASKSRFKDLFDFAPVGYMTVSDKGLIVEANCTAATLLSVVTKTLVGQSLSRFILYEDQDIYYHHRAAIFESAEPQTCKLRLLRTNLPPFWARLTTTPARDAEQDPAMCRIMFSDINDGVRLAEERKQLEAKYQQLQKAESLDRMAGAIAHRFNNMLGVVMGNLQLAEFGIAKETDSGRNITSALQATRRAAELSSTMLTYLGQSIGKHEPLDFSATCYTSLAILRTVMPKEMDMVVDFPTNRLSINANAYQVHQILKNLVTNAWEGHNKRRGTIHLSIKTIMPEDIPAAHCFPLDCQIQQSLHACLTVRDTGCGISAPDIEKLCDPFYTSKFIGRGLGLSVVLGIVRAHGGFITVTSKVGRGSVFSIFFPVCDGENVSTGDMTGCSRNTGISEAAQCW